MALSQRGPLQPVLLAQYPLAKYSYADTASDQHGSISWTHVQSSDLNAIIEKESIQERLNLRVVRAQEQLVRPDKSCFCVRPLQFDAKEPNIDPDRHHRRPLISMISLERLRSKL